MELKTDKPKARLQGRMCDCTVVETVMLVDVSMIKVVEIERALECDAFCEYLKNVFFFDP